MISLRKELYCCSTKSKKNKQTNKQKTKKIQQTTKITNKESAGGTDGGITPAENLHSARALRRWTATPPPLI